MSAPGQAHRSQAAPLRRHSPGSQRQVPARCSPRASGHLGGLSRRKPTSGLPSPRVLGDDDGICDSVGFMVVLSCARTLPALLRENQREHCVGERGAGRGAQTPFGAQGLTRPRCGRGLRRARGHRPADIAPAQPVPLAPRHVPLPGAPMQREERGGGDSRLHLRQLSRFLPTSQRAG